MTPGASFDVRVTVGNDGVLSLAYLTDLGLGRHGFLLSSLSRSLISARCRPCARARRRCLRRKSDRERDAHFPHFPRKPRRWRTGSNACCAVKRGPCTTFGNTVRPARASSVSYCSSSTREQPEVGAHFRSGRPLATSLQVPGLAPARVPRGGGQPSTRRRVSSSARSQACGVGRWFLPGLPTPWPAKKTCRGR
jgi:hypothetical protein